MEMQIITKKFIIQERKKSHEDIIVNEVVDEAYKSFLSDLKMGMMHCYYAYEYYNPRMTEEVFEKIQKKIEELYPEPDFCISIHDGECSQDRNKRTLEIMCDTQWEKQR